LLKNTDCTNNKSEFYKGNLLVLYVFHLSSFKLFGVSEELLLITMIIETITMHVSVAIINR